MIKYDIRTGITKIKTKTAIAISAVILAVGGLGFAVAIPAISHAAGTSCDAGHGAPGGLGKNSPYYWVQSEASDNNTLPNGTVAPSGGANFGQEQGVNTGQTNSSASAACNQ